MYIGGITAVCVRWRTIAISLSALWTTIWHSSSELQVLQPKYVESHVRTHLERAKGQRLDITISHHSRNDALWKRLSRLLKPRYDRCHSLNLAFNSKKELNALIPFQSAMPALTQLTLDFRGHLARRERIPVTIFTTAETLPLRRLTLLGGCPFSLEPLKMTFLTHLRLMYKPVPLSREVLWFLEYTPNLRELDVTTVDDSSTSGHPNPSLPHLHTITFHSLLSRSSSIFLPALNSKMLETLKVINDEFSSIPPNHFPALRTVIFAPGPLGHRQMRNTLRLHPTIENIEFHQRVDVEFAIQWFFPGPSEDAESDEDSTTSEPQTGQAPGLATLRRLKLVQCRWSSPEHAGGFLAKILCRQESLHIESDEFGMSSSALSLMSLKEQYGDRVGILDMEEVSTPTSSM